MLDVIRCILFIVFVFFTKRMMTCMKFDLHIGIRLLFMLNRIIEIVYIVVPFSTGRLVLNIILVIIATGLDLFSCSIEARIIKSQVKKSLSENDAFFFTVCKTKQAELDYSVATCGLVVNAVLLPCLTALL